MSTTSERKIAHASSRKLPTPKGEWQLSSTSPRTKDLVPRFLGNPNFKANE